MATATTLRRPQAKLLLRPQARPQAKTGWLPRRRILVVFDDALLILCMPPSILVEFLTEIVLGLVNIMISIDPFYRKKYLF